MRPTEPTDEATSAPGGDGDHEPMLLDPSVHPASGAACERCGLRPAVYRVLADAAEGLAACAYCTSLLVSPGLDPDPA